MLWPVRFSVCSSVPASIIPALCVAASMQGPKLKPSLDADFKQELLYTKLCDKARHLTLPLPGSQKEQKEVADPENPMKFPSELGLEATNHRNQIKQDQFNNFVFLVSFFLFSSFILYSYIFFSLPYLLFPFISFLCFLLYSMHVSPAFSFFFSSVFSHFSLLESQESCIIWELTKHWGVYPKWTLDPRMVSFMLIFSLTNF